MRAEKKNKQNKDSIAAIATPLGQGGIGIIRISGPECTDIAQRIFHFAKQGASEFRPYVLHHGWIHDLEGNVLDEVLISFMPGPGSYTGEDVVEINCHGGPAVVQSVLELALEVGARLADPGEFTLRAFLNGRLDLSQAEAVAEMISSPTRAGMNLAANKLQGGLRAKVSRLAADLERLRAQLCVAVDFPEEDVQCLEPEELQSGIQEVLEEIALPLRNYEQDRCWREGALVVFAGQVNAGKSSLLNVLLGRERAIVTPIPGTTRDYLEESVNLEGLPVRLVDTAGLRATEDLVEIAGLNRCRELLAEAHLVCIVYDQSIGPVEEDLELARELGPQRAVIVANKQDLRSSSKEKDSIQFPADFEQISVSALLGQGIEELVKTIRSRIVGNKAEPEAGELLPNLRQRQKLSAAREELQQLNLELEQGVPYDLLGIRLESACTHLAEITGEISSAQVLEKIFETFCIGK